MRFALLINAALLFSLLGCSSLQNYSSAIIRGNEAFAIQRLESISVAEALYFNSRGRKGFGTLQQLAGDQLIDPALASGEKDGYLFAVRVVARSESAPASYEVVATPVRYGATGNRSFYLDVESRRIRAADKKGAEATAADPLLE
jgi:hypothetical protein